MGVAFCLSLMLAGKWRELGRIYEVCHCTTEPHKTEKYSGLSKFIITDILCFCTVFAARYDDRDYTAIPIYLLEHRF